MSYFIPKITRPLLQFHFPLLRTQIRIRIFIVAEDSSIYETEKLAIRLLLFFLSWSHDDACDVVFGAAAHEEFVGVGVVSLGIRLSCKIAL